jgi:FAD:protein FMN transferase
MNRKNWFQLLLLLSVIALAAIVHSGQKQEYSQMEIALDTVIEIEVTALPKIALKQIVKEAFDLIKKYEKMYSYYDEESKLYEINNSADTLFVMNEDWKEMFSLAKQVFAQTDSLYDISIGTLTDIWDFETKEIPSSEKIASAQKFIGFENIFFDQTSFIRPQGMKITLGSIAKGFILDKVGEFLQEKEVSSAVINAGGDMVLFGHKKPTKIGIKHPRKEGNEVIEILHLGNYAVVTTGDYERYFEENGTRYHHIINPKTGYPSDSMISITVIHSEAAIADAYATGLFLLSPQKAIEISNSIDDLFAIVFYEEENQLKQLRSKGMEKFIYGN